MTNRLGWLLIVPSMACVVDRTLECQSPGEQLVWVGEDAVDNDRGWACQLPAAPDRSAACVVGEIVVAVEASGITCKPLDEVMAAYAKKSELPSTDGLARIEDLPDLTGYATEQWVADQGYASRASVETTTTALGARIASLEDKPPGGIGLSDVRTLLGDDGYVTEAALAEAGFATEAFVTGQGYLTADALAPYATTSAVATSTAALSTRVAAVEADYLTSTALDGYATQAWVNGKGYATQSFVTGQGYLTSASLAPYALQTWVQGQGYLTPAALDPLATKAYADAGDQSVQGAVDAILGDYLQAADIADMATRTWVTAQAYATLASVTSAQSDITDLFTQVADKADLIATDTTITIPGDFPTIAAAWGSLAAVRIAADATVTLQLGVGTHTATGVTVLNHPDGERIHLVGVTGDAEDVTLRSTQAAPILKVHSGHTLGRVDGLTLDCDGLASHGFVAELGAVALFGQDVVVRGCTGPGVTADLGAVVMFADGDGTLPSFESNGGSGLAATWGGISRARGARATGNGIAGFSAEYGGVLLASNSVADANGGDARSIPRAGYLSSFGSVVGAVDATSKDNHTSHHGAFATYGAAIDLKGATLQGNASGGAILRYGSVGHLPSAAVSSNLKFGVRAIGGSVAILGRFNDQAGTAATVTGNALYGVEVSEHSFADLESASIASNGGSGVLSRSGSYVNALATKSDSNDDFGFRAILGGRIETFSSTGGAGNGSGEFSPAETPNDNTQDTEWIGGGPG